MDHLSRIANIPIPSAEQTVAFAHHVADNHSWYKKLPYFPPGATFVFNLNVNAGRSVESKADGIQIQDVEKPDYFQHPSRLTTQEYLARFGHWDYYVYSNPRMPDSGASTLECFDKLETCSRLPDDQSTSWSTQLTAFLKPGPILNMTLFAAEREQFLRLHSVVTQTDSLEPYFTFARESRKFASNHFSDTFFCTLITALSCLERTKVHDLLQRIRHQLLEFR